MEKIEYKKPLLSVIEGDAYLVCSSGRTDIDPLTEEQMSWED